MIQKIFCSLLLILCVIGAQAANYIETRPPAIHSIKANGVGTLYNFRGPNGGIHKIRITGHSDTANGLAVEFERASSVVVYDFDNEYEFSVKPASTRESDNAESDLSVGLISAGTLAAQAGIIAATGLNQKIKRAYQRIADLRKQMDLNFQKMEQARFDVLNRAITVQARFDQGDSSSQFVTLTSGEDVELRVQNSINQRQKHLERIYWRSQDPDFNRRAAQVKDILYNAEIRDSIDQTYYEISKESLIRADRESFLNNKSEADFLLDIARTSADVLVGLDPFTGTARSLYEMMTGENLITGEKLSGGDHILAALGVLTGGYALKSYKIFRLLKPIAQKVRSSANHTLKNIKNFLFQTGNGFELADRGQPLRKVNFRSHINSNWGLKPKHLNRHFFGKSRFALNKIDPHGTPDHWMQNMAQLIQRPITRKTSNGALDIYDQFPKTKGPGQYTLGVRLWPKQDGTFDLVTILTDQKKGKFNDR